MPLFEAEILVRTVGDNTGLKANLASSASSIRNFEQAANRAAMAPSRGLERTGMALQNFGRMWTQFFTIPVVAGFAVAGVSGYKWEKSLQKISNLTSTTVADTQRYGVQLKKLAVETGQSAQNMAESFYYISSSGFKNADAMKVMTAAAKAAAIGMGDTKTTADVLTSALNAYGLEASKATWVTDVLAKTIEVGKAEPEALASSLGRIMPVAKTLGVALPELGGNVAALTLTGLSAAEAVTALRGTMIALVAPAKMSIDEFAKYGLTVGEVKKKIRDEGLLSTLQMLWQETDHNELSMRKMIPNVRALNGVLAALGPNFGKTTKAIKDTSDAHGALDKAFTRTTESTVFKLEQAWARVKVSFINLGQAILPTIAKIVDKIADWAEAFDKLPDSTKNILLWGAAALAVLGPVSMVLGSIARTVGIIQMAGGIGGLLKGVSLSLGGLAGGAGAGGIASLFAKLVPAAAIAGVIATGVVSGVKQGFEDAQSKLKADASLWQKWDTFWTGFFKGSWKGITDIGRNFEKFASDGIDAYNARLRSSMKSIDNALASSTGQMKLRLQDLKQDLARALDIPAFKQAMKIDLDTKIARSKLLELRNMLVANLHIPMKEANKLMSLVFPKNWGAEFGDKVEQKITRLRTKIKTLIDDLAKKQRWDVDISGGLAKLDKLQDRLKKLTQPNKSTSLKLKLDFAELGGGPGGGKGGDLAQAAKQAVGFAVTAAATKARQEGPTIGANMTSGAVAGVNVNALVAPAIALVRNAIRAANAEAESTSPSKKMMRLGRWMTEGLVIGLKSKEAEAIATASEVAGNILSAFDAVLGIGADIGQMRQNGLFSVSAGRSWAKKVAVRIKAMFKVMWAELKNLDLIDKETKDKTLPGPGTKFSAIATLAGDIGSILSAFSEMTQESLNKSFAALTLVKTKAKQIAKNIVAMAKAIRDAMGGLLITEMTSDNASRAIELANSLAGAITTFADLTYEKIKNGAEQIHNTMMWSRAIVEDVLEIATVIKGAFASSQVDEVVAGAANEAMDLANNLAGVITTFSEMTQEKIDLAVEDMRVLLVEGVGAVNIAKISSNVREIAEHIKAAFAGASEDLVASGAAKEGMDLANNIADVILKFAEMTEATVSSASAGLTRVTLLAPTLGRKIKEMSDALKDAFKVLANDPDFKANGPVATEVNTFVGNITSIISSLAGLYSEETTEGEEGKPGKKTITDLVYNATEGIKNITAGIKNGLVKALLDMVQAFSDALGVTGVKDLQALSDALVKLSEIAGSIKGIVESLADMTAEKVESAKRAGAALGEGFLKGLQEAHKNIILELQSILTDVKKMVEEILAEAARASGAAERAKGAAPPPPGPGKSEPTSATRLPSAAAGAMLTGPKSGYLALLHGTELVTPADRLHDRANSPVVVNQYYSVTVQALEPNERVVSRLMAKMMPLQRQAAYEMSRKVPR